MQDDCTALSDAGEDVIGRRPFCEVPERYGLAFVLDFGRFGNLLH
jgi:hypothetical protein